MKLQKHLSRKVDDKTYYKYVIVVPSNLIEQLNWKDETEIKGTIQKGKLIIEKV